MTPSQLILQLLGMILVSLAIRGRDVMSLGLAISFWLQYQLRDLLYAFGLNANADLGLDTGSDSYGRAITEVCLFNLFLLGFVLWRNRRRHHTERLAPQPWSVREGRLIGFGALASLMVLFFYFGGMQDRSEMILRKGSSLIYLFAIVALIFLCHRKRIGSMLIAAIITFVSTNKLVAVAYLVTFLAKSQGWKLWIVTLLATALVILAALFREPELGSSGLLNLLSGTVFGHYESLLPLYKLIELPPPLEPYSWSRVVFTPFLEFFAKEEKFFESFNDHYFAAEGIVIAPSILGFFRYYAESAAPLLAIAWVIFAITLAEKTFDSLVGTERSPAPKAAFALLLLESSPDGLSFFLRLIVLLCMLRVGMRILGRSLGRSQKIELKVYG